MDFHALFTRLGFSEIETHIYLTLLENEPLSISELSRKIRTYRALLYRSLPLLLERGIVSILKVGKRTLYLAESPEKLRTLYESEQKVFETLIHQMEMTYQTQGEKPILRYFEGREGLKKIFTSIGQTLPKDGVWYRYSSRNTRKSPFEDVMTRYKELRDEKKLQRMVITNDALAKSKAPMADRETVSLPRSYDLFEDNVTKAIYGNTIAFIDGDALTGFTIESEKIAKFEEKIFKLLFKFLREGKKI